MTLKQAVSCNNKPQLLRLRAKDKQLDLKRENTTATDTTLKNRLSAYPSHGRTL